MQKKLDINPDDTTEILSKRLAKAGADLLAETIPAWVDGKIEAEKQDNSKASHCKLINKEDGHISWNEKAEDIYNKFRAFYPWPGIFSLWDKNNSTVRIKFNKISVRKDDAGSSLSVGEIFTLDGEVGVQSSQGRIMLEEIQLEGKKPTSIKEFINGHSNFISSNLK